MAAALGLAVLGCGGAGPRQDPLAAEVVRSSAFLQGKPADSGLWAQVRQANQPVLARAREDLDSGRRQLALQRLANVRVNLALASYLSERPAAQRRDQGGFDAEWARMGGVLRDDLAAPSPAAFDGVPAAARALGEAALPQVRAYYQASLEQGHNTTLSEGLYYLATAQAQRDLAAFCKTIFAASPRRPPPLRSLRTELDDLEADVVKAYRPPASIERHGELILTSSTIKEARELDAAGLRYGALLRYLQAAQLSASLRPARPALAADALSRQLHDFAARLSAGDVDHSLGQLFLELAQAEPASAQAIAGDVLPRYFAALGPARPETPKPAPLVTVTLVRWPYT